MIKISSSNNKNLINNTDNNSDNNNNNNNNVFNWNNINLSKLQKGIKYLAFLANSNLLFEASLGNYNNNTYSCL